MMRVQFPSDLEGMSFDAVAPKLRNSSMDDVERAKCMRTLAVNILAVSLVGQGEERLEDLKKVTEIFLKHCEELLDQASHDRLHLSDVMVHSIKEIQTNLLALTALTSSLPSAAAVDALNSICQAKKGSKFILKQAISQNPFHKKLEQELRRCDVASVTLAPRLAELSTMLAAEAVDPTIVNESVLGLPTWQASLRPGATETLEKALLAVLDRWASTNKAESVSQWCLTMLTHIRDSQMSAKLSEVQQRALTEIASQALQVRRGQVTQAVDSFLGAAAQGALTDVEWKACVDELQAPLESLGCEMEIRKKISEALVNIEKHLPQLVHSNAHLAETVAELIPKLGEEARPLLLLIVTQSRVSNAMRFFLVMPLFKKIINDECEIISSLFSNARLKA